jgi:hypothetical protein
MGFKIYKSAAILSMIHTIKRLDFISRQPLLWDIHLFVIVLWSNKLSLPLIASYFRTKDTYKRNSRSQAIQEFKQA